MEEKKDIFKKAKEKVKDYAVNNVEFLVMAAATSIIAIEYFYVGRAFERAKLVGKLIEDAELAKKLGTPIPFTATMKKTGETAIMMVLPK